MSVGVVAARLEQHSITIGTCMYVERAGELERAGAVLGWECP